MGEQLIVRQNREFLTEILASDPHRPDDPHLYPAEQIYHTAWTWRR
ncbi:MAG: hypothetical protein ACUVSH_04420 [Anaerolineae bacterium]